MAAIGAVQREILDRGLARFGVRDLSSVRRPNFTAKGFSPGAPRPVTTTSRAPSEPSSSAPSAVNASMAPVRRSGGVRRPRQRRLGEGARPQAKRRDRPGVNIDSRRRGRRARRSDRGLLLDGLGLLLVAFARRGEDVGQLARSTRLAEDGVTGLDGRARAFGALLERRGAQRADAAIGHVFQHDVLVDEPGHAFAGLALAADFGNDDPLRGHARQPLVQRGFVLGIGKSRQFGGGQRPALDRQARDRNDHRADFDDKSLGRGDRLRAGGEASGESRERD